MSPQTIQQRANIYIREFGSSTVREEDITDVAGPAYDILMLSSQYEYIISAIQHAEDNDEQNELIAELQRFEYEMRERIESLRQIQLRNEEYAEANEQAQLAAQDARDEEELRECREFQLTIEAEEAELAAQYENYEYDGESFALGETEEDDEDGGGEYEAPEEDNSYVEGDDDDEPPPPPREAEGNYTFSDGCEAPPPTYAFAHARAIQQFDEVINSILEESNELSADNIAELEELRAGRSRHMRALHGVDSDSDAEDDMHTQDT